MEPTLLLLIVTGVLFVATLVRSTLGFGDALLAMPLLTLVIGIQTATPLVAFVASTIALAILLGNWRQVDLRATSGLIISTIIGIPLGLWLLKSAPEPLVKGLLGALLVLFGLYSLLSPALPSITGRLWAYVFGFVAGILGGAYNTNGPPVVVYAALRRWDPERFRATLQGYFFPTGLLIIAGHGLSGLWTPAVWRYYLVSLPLVLLAIFLGSRLNRYIPAGRFERVVHAALVVFGVVLIAGSL